MPPPLIDRLSLHRGGSTSGRVGAECVPRSRITRTFPSAPEAMNSVAARVAGEWGMHTAVFGEAQRRARPTTFGYELADGTGPYELVSWSPERIVAQRWPQYQPPARGFLGTRAPLLDRIEWLAIPNEADRLAALEAGDVDCLHGPPFAEVSRLQNDARFVVTSHPQASTFYLALDWGRIEFDFHSVAVRRALSLALDRRALVGRCFRGIWGTHAQPGTSRRRILR